MKLPEITSTFNTTLRDQLATEHKKRMHINTARKFYKDKCEFLLSKFTGQQRDEKLEYWLKLSFDFILMTKYVRLLWNVNGKISYPDDFALFVITSGGNEHGSVGISADFLQFLKDPSERVQMAAIDRFPYSIIYIDDPSEKIQLAAVMLAPLSIDNIKFPTEKVQLAAIRGDNNAFNKIDDPCEAAWKLYGELY